MIEKINIQKTDKNDLFESIKDSFYKPVYDVTINRILSAEQAGRSIFGKFKNTRLIGAIGIIEKNEDKIEIEYIGVKSEFRKKGIGRELILFVKKYFNKIIIAETDVSAVEFYRAIGFDCEEIIKEYNAEKVVRYKCQLKNNS